MFNRKQSLGLALLLGVSGLWFSTNFAAQDSPALNSPEQIRELLKQRRDILEQRMEAVQAGYEVGIRQLDVLFAAKLDLLDAELELAETQKDRIDALQSILTSLKEAEIRVKELNSVGARGGSIEDVLLATSERLRAEVRLLRETSVASK